MQVRVISIQHGRISPSIQSLTMEYMKRLPRNLLTLHDIPSPRSACSSLEESRLLLAGCRMPGRILALDEDGENVTSHEFTRMLFGDNGGVGRQTVNLVVGGANGHDQTLLAAADRVISLSKMTFPHQIARLLLIEQIYRAYTIKNNHPYHKE